MTIAGPVPLCGAGPDPFPAGQSSPSSSAASSDIRLLSQGGSHTRSTWADVTPKFTFHTNTTNFHPFQGIAVDPATSKTAYVVVDSHRLDDSRPYLFKTTDCGQSWTNLASGLPEDTYLHAVREDPKCAGLLFAGTDRGVVLSRDGGSDCPPAPPSGNPITSLIE